MKATTSPPLFSIFAILLFSFSLVNSNQDLDNFFQCLLNNSSPSHPIADTIFTPNNASFLSALQSHIRNSRYFTPTTPKPLVILAAKHESHVQATVVCAKQHGLQVRIRSGGHDLEGLSYVSDVPFIILDMFNLKDIQIDIVNETAWVQAGATVGELYYRIAEKSKVHAFPAGVCFSLGTGGHFSGGGYGNLMRKYGLSVDNIFDAQIVTVNGTILDRTSMGEDLFWAIRGGGGSSFGVILSWKIRLVRVPANVTVFNVKRTLEQNATYIVDQWQNVAHELPNELFIRVQPNVVNGSQEGKNTVRVSFIGLFLGQPEILLRVMSMRFPALGLQENDCHEMSWIESTLFWYDLPIGTPIDTLLTNPSGLAFYKGKSDYVKIPIPKTGLESIWNALIQVEKGYMEWNPYGGEMSEISESDTPFPHRAGNMFQILYSVAWFENGTEATNRYINMLENLYDAMTLYASKNPREAFLNYRDLDIGRANSNNQTLLISSAKVYGSKYFKNNFERLVSVKTRIDPYNFFRNEQSIPPLPGMP